MKKRLMALALTAAVGATALTGCGSNQTAATTAAPATEAAKTETTVAPATEAAPAADGSVYYLNFKPAQDQQWQDLAKAYTEETGVPVTVVTAASGEYETTLMSEMGKSSAPTLFQVNGPVGLANWTDYCYDLSGSEIYGQLTSEDFALKDGDAVKGIAYVVESYGIIANKTLLEQAGHSIDEITSFETLKAVAEDITARKDELGFSAFSSAGLDDSSAWRFTGHLANMPLYYEFNDNNITSQPATITGAYLENYKAIWDLYINNATCAPSELATKTGDESEAEFGRGEAVFFQNGTWEYANLTGEEKGFKMNPDDITMIPIYCGVSGEEESGLCCGTENCWAVNSKASEEDIQATLDFIKWVVTSDEGTKMMAEQFGPIPFKSAKDSENVFFTAANNYISDGKYVVTWAFNYTPNVDTWRAGVESALLQYSANGESWDNVKTAFVDGWATQYQAQ